MSARKTISNSFSVSTLEDGVVYDLRLTSGIVVQHDNGTRTPSTITISAYERRGEGDVELYTGDILLYNASGSLITAYENYNTVNLTMNQAESVFPISVKLLTHAESELLAETAISLAKDGQTIAALDLDNEYDSVNTDSTGKITAATTKSTIVRLYNGSTEVDISAATISVSGSPASSIATFSQSAEPNSGKGRVLSWSFIAAQTMTDYNIDISYTYNSVTYRSTFTIVASKGQPIYQIQPTMTSVPFAYSNGSYTPASRNVGLAIVKLDGVGSRTMSTFTNAGTVDGGAVYVRYSKTAMPTSKTDGTAWTQGISTTVSVANTDTNLYIAIFSSDNVLLDRETIPVVKDGIKGDRGKIGRFYYYSGFDWDASNTTNKFVVNDAQVPFFSKAGSYSNQYYVFNRKETPSGGEMTMAQMAAETSVGGQIQWNNTPWEVMTNDFKYLISQAIFSDFAKLGSSIFNKDFMISQWGEKNGLQSTDYQTFNPYFFRSDTYVAFSGKIQVSSEDYAYDSPLKVSSILVETGHTYTISMTGSTTGGYLVCELFEDSEWMIGNVRAIITASSQTTASFTYTRTSSSAYINIGVFAAGGSAVVTGTITEITVKDNDWTASTFIPNITLDFFRGYIYARQGFFKNVTVEGVLNNLITDIDFIDNVNEDLFIPMTQQWDSTTQTGDYDAGDIYWGNIGTPKYSFDALKSGSMVRLKSDATAKYVFLPWFAANNQFIRTSTLYDGTQHLLTEAELRQLVGKKITFFSDYASTNIQIVLPCILSDTPVGQDLPTFIVNEELSIKIPIETGTVSSVALMAYRIQGTASMTVELKTGLRTINGSTYEIFYWSVQRGIHANTGWT